MTVNGNDDIRLDTTQEEVLAWFSNAVHDGVTCPTCGQFAKVYKRTINKGMAKALINQWRNAGTETVHTKKLWLPFSKEAAQLSWWGLIEPGSGPTTSGRTNGFWRVTDEGAEYVANRLKVEKFAYVYDGQVLRKDGDEVGITSVIPFDYNRMMAGIY